MPKIAVCDYARDTQPITRRIIERLSSLSVAHPLTFVRLAWTLDDPDFDAAEELSTLNTFDIALVIVGADWPATLRVNAARPHFDLELLLNFQKPLILVLLDRTAMVRTDELSPRLKTFASFDAVSISTDAAFDEDVDRLYQAVQSTLNAPQRPAVPAPAPDAPPAHVPQSRQPLPIAALMRKRQQARTRANWSGEVILGSILDRPHRFEMPEPSTGASAPQYVPSPQHSAPLAAKASRLWPLLFGAAALITAAGYFWRHELGLAAGGLFKLLGLASAPPMPAASPIREILDASAFAPAAGQAGDEVLVQIFLHAGNAASAAASIAQEADSAAARRGVATLAIEVAVGQRIDVVLEAGAIPIDEASQSLTWRGEPRSCQFFLKLPRDQAGRTCAIKARILVDSVPAGALRFSLKVVAEAFTIAPDLVGDAAHRYRRAFLSHSHEDRVKVLTYAQLLDAIGIKYFQDIASLRAMEQWEYRLHEAIDGCDLFLLFWTANAAHSEWVERETRYALERQRRSGEETPDIMPVFLEADPPQPPAWLKSRHFDSILRLAMRGAQADSEKGPL
jgi:hypothetical protein